MGGKQIASRKLLSFSSVCHLNSSIPFLILYIYYMKMGFILFIEKGIKVRSGCHFCAIFFYQQILFFLNFQFFCWLGMWVSFFCLHCASLSFVESQVQCWEDNRTWSTMGFNYYHFLLPLHHTQYLLNIKKRVVVRLFFLLCPSSFGLWYLIDRISKSTVINSTR